MSNIETVNNKVVDIDKKKVIQQVFRDIISLKYNSIQGVRKHSFIRYIRTEHYITIDDETLIKILNDIGVIEDEWIDPDSPTSVINVLHYRERHLDNAIDRELNVGNWESERDDIINKMNDEREEIDRFQEEIKERIDNINELGSNYNNIIIPEFQKKYGEVSPEDVENLKFPYYETVSDIDDDLG